MTKIRKGIQTVNRKGEYLYCLKENTNHESVLTGEKTSETKLKADVVDALNIEPASRILDISFGPVPLVTELVNNMWKVHYFGLETAPELVAKATAVFADHINDRKALFELYDGKKVPYVVGFFHRVLHVSPAGEPVSKVVLREGYRVLTENGIMVLVHRPRGQFEEAVAVANTARATGFTVRDLKMFDMTGKGKLRAEGPEKYVITVLVKPGKHPERGSR
ncbi:hypothetical protein LS482_18805 [Sinomicrobium kalidii]|uniref:class I SAM-dependent methyltransferase n=1 Tax=Sinomicrobium kalidii TaxID=2900738 RepID=UPI001E3597BE|nr:hypothetical protein [Sinomicrobium kalidii]UGU15718.1 hypothetical protein LS482_18805 [Sinomicrobium kalidii]